MTHPCPINGCEVQVPEHQLLCNFHWKRVPAPLRATITRLYAAGKAGHQPMVLTKPLLVMFEQDGSIVCHIWPRKDDTYKGYGLLICDAVRHVARAFKVHEDAVWEWVEKEHYHPTTTFSSPS